MCVDDDPVIRSVIRFTLQRSGCKDVVPANGGRDALDLCAGRKFDLLICDFQMSPMTGLEFLRELAASGLGEGWPVIMLSAATEAETIKEARELGVSAWVGKPVSSQALLEQICTVLRDSGRITRSRDPEHLAVAERHHARLMAGLRTAEESVQGLSFRARDAVSLAQSIHQVIDDVNEHARTLGYGLITMLAARASELVVAMTRNPGAATRGHATCAGVLATLFTTSCAALASAVDVAKLSPAVR